MIFLTFLLLASLVFINIYALTLVVLRGVIYKTKIYRPMLKNIFLSILPVMVLFVIIIITFTQTDNINFISVLILILLLITWFLLLPNSGYLITELNFNHRKTEEKETVPLWYDIICTLTLATSGIINTLFNVFCIQIILIIFQFIQKFYYGENPYSSQQYAPNYYPFRPDKISMEPSLESWIIVAIIIFIITFGIYLGRYIRFNSWDVLKPWNFFKKINKHFKQKGNITNTLAFCVSHTIFLGALYVITATPVFMLITKMSTT